MYNLPKESFKPTPVDEIVRAFVEGKFQPIRTNQRLYEAYNGAEPNDLYWVNGEEVYWIGEEKTPGRESVFAEVWRLDSAYVDLWYVNENGEWEKEPV